MRSLVSSRRGRAADVAVAVGIGIFGLVEVVALQSTPGAPVPTVLVALLAAAALPWRCTAPAAVAVWVGLMVASPALVGAATDSFALFLTLLLAAYSVGAHAPGRRTVSLGVGGLLGGIFIATAATDGAIMDYVFAGSLCILAVVFGRIARVHAVRATAAESLATRLDLDREEQVARAVADERAHIAREMHDVISHSVSLMVIQAGAAERSLGNQAGDARTSLATIQDLGEETVTELSRMLGVLRGPEAGALLSPQPGTHLLPELVEQCRAAGVVAELCVDGTARRLPAGVDLAVFRIVQEALTNVRKHAEECSVAVSLNYGHSELEILVEDDGRHNGAPSGIGHGLVGMQERATIYGGHLEAGRGAERGFRVRVVLPIGDVGQ